MNTARRTRRGGDRRGVGGVLPAVSLPKVKGILGKKNSTHSRILLHWVESWVDR